MEIRIRLWNSTRDVHFSNLAVRQSGSLAVWRSRSLAVSQFDSLAVWQDHPGSLAVFAVCQSGSLGSWLSVVCRLLYGCLLVVDLGTVVGRPKASGYIYIYIYIMGVCWKPNFSKEVVWVAFLYLSSYIRLRFTISNNLME